MPIIGDGKAGPITASAGTFAYLEVCRMLATGTYTIIKDPLTKVPHAYSYDGDLWFSYDDETSVKEKVCIPNFVGTSCRIYTNRGSCCEFQATYALKNKIGAGIMVFSTDQDGKPKLCIVEIRLLGAPQPRPREFCPKLGNQVEHLW